MAYFPDKGDAPVYSGHNTNVYSGKEVNVEGEYRGEDEVEVEVEG